MRYQEAAVVVALPLDRVQERLGHVEDWPAFLNSVARAEPVAHERWRFDMVDPVRGSGGRECRVVVHVDHHRHELRWRSLDGPRFTGRFTLTPVDERHTRIQLALSRFPERPLNAVMEMVLPRTRRAEVDLRDLDRYLTTA